MSQKPTKNIFLLVWCLGRPTTPFKAAEKYYTIYDISVKFDPKNTSIMGPFYSAKRDLLNRNLLLELSHEGGREKPIKTNMQAYLADFTPIKPYLAEFETYARKIVDKMLDRKLAITNEYEPLFYFLLAKLLLCAEKEANGKWITKILLSIADPNAKSEVLNCIIDFKDSLTKKEADDLIESTDIEAFVEIFKTVIQKAPMQLLRPIMMWTLTNPKLLKLRVISNNK
jgi:hypothetical protein